MSRYLTPLAGVMASAIEFVLNRAVALDPEATQALEPLDGRWLKFEFDGLDIEMWLAADHDHFRVLAESGDDDLRPEATIGGTPAALLAMVLPVGEATADVRIQGNPRLAQKFQQAMKHLDPDIEAALSDWFGDLIGPQIWRVVLETAEFGRHAARTSVGQFSQWLGEESDLVPRPHQWRAFRDGVDELREAVDRLESSFRRNRKS